MAVDADAAFAERVGPALRHLALLVWRYLDVVLVLVALVPALAYGVPALGYIFGAAGWVLQRVVAATDRRWTRKVTSPVKRLGVDLFEAFGRIWLLAGVIVVADLVGGRRDGLTAAVVIMCAYSVAFVIRVLTGPPSRSARR